MAIHRVRQTLRHLISAPISSFLQGPSEPALLEVHLGGLLDEQCQRFSEKVALVCSSDGDRYTFSELRERSRRVARGLLKLGVRHGDMIGILAGNCAQYVELLFACGRIGAILAVLNTTYTPAELQRALIHSGRVNSQV